MKSYDLQETMQETQEMQKYQETQLYWTSWYLRCCIKEEAKWTLLATVTGSSQGKAAYKGSIRMIHSSRYVMIDDLV